MTPAHVTCDQMTDTSSLPAPQALNQGEIKARSPVCGAVRHVFLSYQELCVWFRSHASSTNTAGVRARPRSCSFEAPSLNHGRNARVANPTKRAPIDATRADRASAAQPTVEVAATGRRRPRTICHTERTSVRQSVPASAECVRAMWSRWRPCVLAALAGRGARVRESGRASKRHARQRAPSCTATASHAVPPIPPVAAPAEGLGRTSQRAWLLQQNYAHDAVTAQWSAAASPASPGAILLVEHAPAVAEACGVSGCVSE